MSPKPYAAGRTPDGAGTSGRAPRLIAAVIALALVGVGPPVQGRQPGAAPPSSRIVAIGDIHGDIQALTTILRTAGLIDESKRWAGGRATLVQTGDYTDRGEHVREVMDLLIGLESQARRAGGRAVILLGNHEVMNLLGETRDANGLIYARFADADSPKRLDRAWEDLQKIAGKASSAPAPAVFTQTREAFTQAHPLGYAEYREAMGPRGRYGSWLRDKAMVTMLGGSIFMHAGIAPETAPLKLDELNEQVRAEVRRMDRFVQRLVDKKLALPFFTLDEILQVAAAEIRAANERIAAIQQAGEPVDLSQFDMPLLREAEQVLKVGQWVALNPDGALWWRGLATLPDDPAGGPFPPLLARYGAVRFVTGHTPTPDRRINVRFGGRAVLIDTGMNAAVYMGRPAAAEIVGDRLTAIYEDGRVALTPATAARAQP